VAGTGTSAGTGGAAGGAGSSAVVGDASGIAGTGGTSASDGIAGTSGDAGVAGTVGAAGSGGMAGLAGAGGVHDTGDGASDASQDQASDEPDGDEDGPRRDAELDGRHDDALVDGASEAGPKTPVVGSCTASAVTSCDPADRGTQCEEKFCGGRLWLLFRSFNGYIPYRILDPSGKFSSAYRQAIDAGAAAWTQATKNLVTFEKCSDCTGRFVSVVPGDGDGIVDPTAWEQVLPMPVKMGDQASPPLHRIAHQWGHVIGLDDTYRRADRDGLARFDPAVWCGAGGPGAPARCAVDPADEPGAPHLPSGTFGVYDELSKMNGLPTEGICGSASPDPDSGQPTLGDVSAVAELYFGSSAGWSPFIPVGPSIPAGGTRNYELAPDVDPVGVPAVATWTAPAVEIFARGTDGKLYGIQNEVFGTRFVDWTDWTPLGDGFVSDPSAVFAASDTLHLGAVSSGGNIRLRSRVAGTWDDWFSLTGPPVNTTSAPALAAADERSVDVLVRGGDGAIYHFACADTRAHCATNGSSPAGWTPLPSGPSGGFIGKPSAAWSGGWLFVTAVDSAHAGWLIAGYPGYWGTWVALPVELPLADPEPSIGVAAGAYLNFFAPEQRGLLVNATREFGAFTVGGILASAPNAASPHDGSRLEVTALIDDHGRRGVWWKFHGGFLPACVYNRPGTCAECGCGLPGQPSCAY
jgi:hypothetical protein